MEILMCLEGTPDEHTTESLRWDLYERNGRTLPAKLPIAWQTQFSKAVKSLEKKGVIRVAKRKLNTLAECVKHFPGKTLETDVRKLRQAFLPLLIAWSREKSGPRLRYDEASNERFHAEEVPSERNLALKNRWTQVEDKLLPVFSNNASDDLLLLICKGRSFFGLGGTEVPRSFRQLIDQACSESIVAPELVNELQSIRDELFPDTIAGELMIKSFVHTFAYVPGRGKSGPCTLKEKTLRHLHRQAKDLVEALPNFKPPAYPFEIEPVHSPSIHKLLDRTLFQRFSFLNSGREPAHSALDL